jgi:hypothetical protein
MLKSTARPEKSSTTEHPTSAVTSSGAASRTQVRIIPRMIRPQNEMMFISFFATLA